MSRSNVIERGLTIKAAHQLVLSTVEAVGEEFFQVMAKSLAETMNIRWVMVSRTGRRDSQHAMTAAVWDNGPAENFKYSLGGSPCENILTQGICRYEARLQEQFPRDRLLKDMGAESYVGIPLQSSNGKIIGLIAAMHDAPMANTDDVAHALHLFAGRAGAELERIAAASASERLGKIVEDSVSEAYVFAGDTFKFELVNRGARENLGYSLSELYEMTPWDLKPDYTEAEFKNYVDPLLRGDCDDLKFETRHARKDGSIYDVEVRLQFFGNPDNVFFASINDVTQRKAADQRENLLVREVNHRSKNLLSLVQVIARQTARNSPEDFNEKLEERIASLAANQDLLVNNCWSKIPLNELVRSHLEPFKDLIDKRILISGPIVELKPNTAQVLGMAIHELATNTAKYGALSNRTGEVRIEWEIDQADATFTFRWDEAGGPVVSPPTSTGFGSTLITRQPSMALSAEITTEYKATGLDYRLKAPTEQIVDVSSDLLP